MDSNVSLDDLDVEDLLQIKQNHITPLGNFGYFHSLEEMELFMRVLYLLDKYGYEI